MASRRKAAETAAKDRSGLRLDLDAGGPGMRDWLQDIGHRDGLAAAFDTRVNGLAVLTGRASRRIARLHSCNDVCAHSPWAFPFASASASASILARRV